LSVELPWQLSLSRIFSGVAAERDEQPASSSGDTDGSHTSWLVVAAKPPQMVFSLRSSSARRLRGADCADFS
jgi:hypothetical protein